MAREAGPPSRFDSCIRLFARPLGTSGQYASDRLGGNGRRNQKLLEIPCDR